MIGFDNNIIINTIFVQIINILNILKIFVVIYLNCKILYEYLIKLKNITKKRFIINIIFLYKLYKDRKISKIK